MHKLRVKNIKIRGENSIGVKQTESGKIQTWVRMWAFRSDLRTLKPHFESWG